MSFHRICVWRFSPLYIFSGSNSTALELTWLCYIFFIYDKLIFIIVCELLKGNRCHKFYNHIYALQGIRYTVLYDFLRRADVIPHPDNFTQLAHGHIIGYISGNSCKHFTELLKKWRYI